MDRARLRRFVYAACVVFGLAIYSYGVRELCEVSPVHAFYQSFLLVWRPFVHRASTDEASPLGSFLTCRPADDTDGPVVMASALIALGVAGLLAIVARRFVGYRRVHGHHRAD